MPNQSKGRLEEMIILPIANSWAATLPASDTNKQPHILGGKTEF